MTQHEKIFAALSEFFTQSDINEAASKLGFKRVPTAQFYTLNAYSEPTGYSRNNERINVKRAYRYAPARDCEELGIRKIHI